jgi:hypothetical protein
MSVEPIREPDGGDEPAASSEQPSDMSHREWTSLKDVMRSQAAVTKAEGDVKRAEDAVAKAEERLRQQKAYESRMAALAFQRRAAAVQLAEEAHMAHRAWPVSLVVLLAMLTVLMLVLEVYVAAVLLAVATLIACLEVLGKWTSKACAVCQGEEYK